MEKFVFEVRKSGRVFTETVEAANKAEAILRLESRIGSVSMDEWRLLRRTVQGKWIVY